MKIYGLLYHVFEIKILSHGRCLKMVNVAKLFSPKPHKAPSEHVSPPSVSSRPNLTHPNPPQSSNVANLFISSELNHLKDEIKSMKADIAAVFHGRQTLNTSSSTDAIGHEVMAVKEELTCLCEAVSLLSSSRHGSQCHNTPPPTTQVQTQPTVHVCNKHSPSLLNIIAWNCRGLKNATQYLSNLLEGSADIVALSEHWLWPFE